MHYEIRNVAYLITMHGGLGGDAGSAISGPLFGQNKLVCVVMFVSLTSSCGWELLLSLCGVSQSVFIMSRTNFKYKTNSCFFPERSCDPWYTADVLPQ